MIEDIDATVKRIRLQRRVSARSPKVPPCRYTLHSRRGLTYYFVCNLDHEHPAPPNGTQPRDARYIDVNTFWGERQPGFPFTAHSPPTPNTLLSHPDKPRYSLWDPGPREWLETAPPPQRRRWRETWLEWWRARKPEPTVKVKACRGCGYDIGRHSLTCPEYLKWVHRTNPLGHKRRWRK